MTKKKGKLKKPQKRLMLKYFLAALGTTLGLCALVVIAFVYNYNTRVLNQGTSKSDSSKGDQVTETQEMQPDPLRTSIAIFGVDEDGYRPDAMFTLHFDSESNQARVISFPRDIKVTWTQEQKDMLSYYGKRQVSVSKINEMTTYGGIDNIRDFTINEMENILGVPIDNYIIIDLDTFKDFIDAIGGVEMDVPQRMYYNDYSQGLHIDLQPGVQVLDGDKAEQLVRFRRYPEGDVARVRTQQLFLEAVVEKVTSPSIILKLPTLINLFFDNVTTDISLLEMPKYISYLQAFDPADLEFYMLPGSGGYENGVSYFFIDWDQMDDFLDEVFSVREKDDDEVVIDKEVSIEILNGSGISELASKAGEEIEQEGYTVSSIGNYATSDIESTIIYAKEEAKAKQFLAFYQGAEIVETTDITHDIQIVLGKDVDQ